MDERARKRKNNNNNKAIKKAVKKASERHRTSCASPLVTVDMSLTLSSLPTTTVSHLRLSAAKTAPAASVILI